MSRQVMRAAGSLRFITRRPQTSVISLRNSHNECFVSLKLHYTRTCLLLYADVGTHIAIIERIATYVRCILLALRKLKMTTKRQSYIFIKTDVIKRQHLQKREAFLHAVLFISTTRTTID